MVRTYVYIYSIQHEGNLIHTCTYAVVCPRMLKWPCWSPCRRTSPSQQSILRNFVISKYGVPQLKNHMAEVTTAGMDVIVHKEHLLG